MPAKKRRKTTRRKPVSLQRLRNHRLVLENKLRKQLKSDIAMGANFETRAQRRLQKAIDKIDLMTVRQF
jgi:hypothetical protein